MDGGIIDNQGIDGIKTFLDRKDGGTNLFIISDSSPRSSKIYEGKSKTRSRWLAVTSLFFVSIFLHEFAHAVAAKMEKLEVVEIVLHPFGGLTRFRHEPETPRAEFRIAVAGPAAAASFIIAVVFVLLMAAANAAGLDILAILLFLLGLLNFLIAVFNMLPGYPLDGGRVLRFFGSLNKNRSFHCKSSKMFDIGTLSVANQILMNC